MLRPESARARPGRGGTPSPYRVVVDWAPAYELVTSLHAFLGRQHHRILELGTGWAARVRKLLAGESCPALNAAQTGRWELPPALLVQQAPGDRAPDGFLDWLRSLSPGQIYEHLAPYIPDGGPPLPKDLAGWRDAMVGLLAEWNDLYFSRVDPAVLSGLAAEASARRTEAGEAEPIDFVEKVTGGLRVEPTPDLKTVLLVPQHHFRPINIHEDYPALMVICYPAEVLPAAPGEPPATLLRLSRALGDGSRLRILRFLAGRPRTFGEVARFSGLAKSTVHQHMVALRAAGLVLVHCGPRVPERYSFRPAALDEARAGLGVFLLTPADTGPH